MTQRKVKKPAFDPQVFLATLGQGRKMVTIPKGATVFSQGDPCDAIFYIQSGKIKITVVSKTGKEATIGIFGGGDFFGEDSLVVQHLRMGTATALTDCALMRIEKKAMLKVLQSQHGFSGLLM